MNALEVAKKENISITRSVSVVLASRNRQPTRIEADSSGNGPTKFELLKVGMWRTPWHGDIMIMPGDLTEYVANKEAGYGVSGNNKLKLPINYGHDKSGKAAGWFNLAIEGDTLFAIDVEWTPAGLKALEDGEWKCISAEFCPAGRGGWCDPLDDEHYVENVIEGAALTNIPLFSNLEPVMASATFGKDKDAKPEVFLITAAKETTMTVEEINAKDPATLNEDEKKFVSENADKFTDEQKTKLGLEVKAADPAPADPAAKPEGDTTVPEKTAEEKEAAAVTASIKSGEKTLVDASAWKATQDQLKELRMKDIKGEVTAHAARGAIKADQIDTWADSIAADASGNQKKMLESLPSNPVLADVQGSDKDAGDATALEAELHEKVVADRKAAYDKDGKAGSYAEVRASIIKSDAKFSTIK